MPRGILARLLENKEVKRRVSGVVVGSLITISLLRIYLLGECAALLGLIAKTGTVKTVTVYTGGRD